MSQSNGHAATPAPVTREQVQDARRRLAFERTNLQLQRLASAKKLLEGTTSSEFWVNSTWDRLDRFRSEPDFPFTSTYDRRHGRNFPIYQNEIELSQLRMQSRIIATVNSYAGGLLEGLCSYIISTGYTYRATSKRKEQPAPEPLLNAIQDIIDDFLERNGWYGAWEPGREEELFFRQYIDGEYFIRFFEDSKEKDRLLLRAVEPDQVTQNGSNTGEEASFGILTPEDDQENHLKYWVNYLTGTTLEGEWIERGAVAGKMMHLRRFVTRNIKRGLPFFGFDTLDALHIGSRLRRNMSMGAAIQACIAGVRQHANATKGDVEAMQDLVTDYEYTHPRTGQQQHVQKHEPGITDVPKGQEWVNPPTAQNAAAHVQILQACLRGAGVRINAPEWIVSADASNNNYASSMTAESPWVRQVLRQQRGTKETNRAIMWAAVEHYVKAHGDKLIVRVPTGSGSFTEQSISLKVIREVVDIQAEAPTPETRNKMEESQRDQIYLMNKVKSVQTCQQEQGLDTEQERINQEKWNEQNGGQGDALGTGDPGAGDGQGGDIPADAAANQADAVAGGDLRTTVGGLQAIAALQADYYGGKLPREAGIANVVLLFGFKPEEAGQLFPDTPPDAPQAPEPAAPPDAGGGLPAMPGDDAGLMDPFPESRLLENNDDSDGVRAARNAVLRALEDGTLKKGKCKCGSSDVQAHHEDYRKPLEVKWVCRKCHDKEHGKDVSEVRLLKLAKAYWMEAAGTCKPGERADLTGCSPATSDPDAVDLGKGDPDAKPGADAGKEKEAAANKHEKKVHDGLMKTHGLERPEAEQFTKFAQGRDLLTIDHEGARVKDKAAFAHGVEQYKKGLALHKAGKADEAQAAFAEIGKAPAAKQPKTAKAAKANVGKALQALTDPLKALGIDLHIDGSDGGPEPKQEPDDKTKRTTEAKGTCKPGERADLTHCTPASDDPAASKPTAEPAHGDGGRPAKGTGTKADPFRCGSNIQLAAKLLSEGHYIRLKQPDQVATLIDKMDQQIQAAVALGEKAPVFDLCKVTAKGTNLFCQDTLGIPRVKMPQMRGVPVPGSYAATLKAGKKSGKVDLSADFIEHLKKQGIATELTKVRASHLRASQNQIVGARVVQLIKETQAGTRDLREKPIFVTRDNYVVDGHHHWAAIVGHGYAKNKDMQIPVYKLDMEIGQALAMANEFTKKSGLAPKAG